ncbi:hypothetical protein D9615_002383 [Tricholomella constricta]|uniref:Mediator of RNA polymerase II transcription subunit 1 n=1 Tax=Tricholomella constricta TaxID=117010 RepID=A0A8H5HNC4_9AGAR|nr:hypothetical protein D9615_002383 [Tricholomella constricta]
MTTDAMNSPPPTLLSTIQEFQKHDIVSPNASHPFASSTEQSCSRLQELINTADQLAHSLNTYSSTSLSNPKLVSLLRQHSSIDHTLHQSDRSIHQIIDALRTRSGSNYGEDIPLDPAAIVDWCISRLETWGTSAGMETFKDDGREGGISVVLGGKVLVVDVDFSVDRVDPLKPRMTVSSVKTSYAITNSEGSTSNSGGSISLDAFLRASIENFCVEVQKPEDVRNLEVAASLGVIILEQLQYLVMLDRLAARTKDGGLKWFVDLDELCPILEAFAKNEAEAVASSLSLSQAPLDIFLLRSHALPLPYLTSPSISFLVHLSPLAYLTLLRKPTAPVQDDPNLPQLDIPLISLRSKMPSILQGMVVATLSLTTAHAGQVFPATMAMPTFTARPTFPLVPQGSDLEHMFPKTVDIPASVTLSNEPLADGQYTWILDFTNGCKNPGIVMSQSRMREIELAVNPLGGIDTLNPVTMMSFGTGSWVDLLLNSAASVSPERYTALYTSPTSVHPPLQLRLTAPEEPGFRLEKVPVHNMKEVVREQCWLNEILSGCQWTAEGLKNSKDELPQENPATEEELQAVLNGNLLPRKIPVNVFLPSQNIATDALFQASDLDGISLPQIQPRRPRIVMTSPERPPISGLVEIAVVYDESRPRGIVIEINGAMGSDLEADVLEEICRRGGTLGLSGRVWAKAHGSL